MWIPLLLEQLNESEMQDLGMEITADDIYSINHGSLKDAIVHFGGFCTSEIISDQGLLLTNHHCGYGAIQSHSSLENDYLKNGFWAMSQEEELPNKGLTATLIKRIEDVSARVLYGVKESMTEAERDEVIAKNIETVLEEELVDTHYEGIIRPFYIGNQYYLFITEKFLDVRMVGAPPSSIGKYGADTDNWMWPRHTGDFSLFRIYANSDNLPEAYSETNVPYQPLHHLPINMSGLEEGDFTMIFGFPGRTDEYIPSYGVEQVVKLRNSANIKTRKMALEIMDAYMRHSDKIRIQYASTYASISNAWKKWIGQNIGIRETRGIEKKQELEALFMERVSNSRRFDSSYKKLLPNFKEAYSDLEPYALARDYMIETCYRSIKSVNMGFQTKSFIKAYEEEEQDWEKIEKLYDQMLSTLEGHFKDYDQDVDRDLALALLPHYYNHVPEILSDEMKELRNSKDPEAAINKAYDKSILSNEDLFTEVKEKGMKKMYKCLKKDPLAVLSIGIWSHYEDVIRPGYNGVNARIDSMMRIYMSAQMEVIPERTYYPDANSTLRVSYGQVKGLEPRDAVTYDPFTTLDGVIAKYVPGDYEFDLPAKLIELWEKKDYGDYANSNGAIPVCFIASNHTTGGNSGSPAIDGQGRLIGLNFDRIWEGTMSDLNFDESRCRNIMVDVRYVLFIVDKFAGATHLIEEMDLVYDVAEEEEEVVPEEPLLD